MKEKKKKSRFSRFLTKLIVVIIISLVIGFVLPMFVNIPNALNILEDVLSEIDQEISIGLSLSLICFVGLSAIWTFTSTIRSKR